MIWRFLFSTSVAPSFHHATVRSMSNIMICPWKNHNIVHEAPTRGHGGSRSGTRWTRIFLRPIRVIIGPITYCNPPVLPPCPDSAIHEQCCDSSIDKSQHRSWISARSLVDGGRLGTTNSSHCCEKKNPDFHFCFWCDNRFDTTETSCFLRLMLFRMSARLHKPELATGPSSKTHLNPTRVVALSRRSQSKIYFFFLGTTFSYLFDSYVGNTFTLTRNTRATSN